MNRNKPEDDMEIRIKSRKTGEVFNFSRPGREYIFCDLNGQSGTLGKQICRGGKTTGSTLSYSGDDEAEFARICRNWYRAYMKHDEI